MQTLNPLTTQHISFSIIFFRERMQVAEIASMEKTGNTDPEFETESVYERLGKLASANAVVVFATTGCCMCHVVKQLLFGLGVAPAVIELDHDSTGSEIHALLYHLAGDDGGGVKQPVVPAIFVGGKFLGGVQTLMACHINGSLVPLLKEAGALWL